MNRLKVFKQYFTPPAVADFIVKSLKCSDGMKVIDPAAGDGAFVRSFSKHLNVDFTAVEIDPELSEKLEFFHTSINLKILTGNGLDPRLPLPIESFDVAVGNPPFSSQKNLISDHQLLKFYTLCKMKQSAEILFLERFIQLIKPGGRVGIILPINIFANSPLQYVRKFIFSKLQIIGIVQLPKNLFPSTSAKTAILLAIKSNNGHIGNISLYNINSLSIFNSNISLSSLDQYNISITDALERMDPEYFFRKQLFISTIDVSKHKFVPLSDVCNISSGYRKYPNTKYTLAQDPSCFKKSIPLLKAKNYDKLGFRPASPLSYIDSAGPHFNARSIILRDNIVFTRVGIGCIGRSLWMPDENTHYQADDWLFVLKSFNIHPALLTLYLNSRLGKKLILIESQGTGTVSISKRRLRSIPVPILRGKIVDIISETLKLIYRLYGQEDPKNALYFYSILDDLLKRELFNEIS